MFEKCENPELIKKIKDEISSKLISVKSIDEAAFLITNAIGNYLGADRVAMKLYDSDLDIFTDVIGEYLKDENIPTIHNKDLSLKDIDFCLKEFIGQEKVLIVADLTKPDCPFDLAYYFKNLGMGSLIVVSLRYKGSLTGMISISNVKPNKIYSEAKLECVKSIIASIMVYVELFKAQNKIKQMAKNESLIIKIFEEAKSKKAHDELFTFILEKLVKLFDVDLGLHFHHQKGSTFVINEYLKNKTDKTFVGEEIFCTNTGRSIFPSEEHVILIVNDLNTDIDDEGCKNYWLKNNVQSFLLYSPGELEVSRKEIKVVGGTLIGQAKPRRWSADDVDTFKIVMNWAITLYIAIVESQEVEEVKKDYMSTLTHDLRTPIIASQKAIEYITSQNPDTSISNFRELLEEIRTSNEELLLMINNLLSIYYIESGKYKPTFEKFNIGELLEESEKMVKGLIIGTNSNIEIQIQNTLPKVYASRGDIKRVLSNLVNNSLKHNKKDVKITLSAKKEEDFILICVKDNGEGIEDIEKNIIFQRYVSGKSKAGTGLGLYLSKQIIDAHNGKIWVESQKDKGASFYFTLPISKN